MLGRRLTDVSPPPVPQVAVDHEPAVTGWPAARVPPTPKHAPIGRTARAWSSSSVGTTKSCSKAQPTVENRGRAWKKLHAALTKYPGARAAIVRKTRKSLTSAAMVTSPSSSWLARRSPVRNSCDSAERPCARGGPRAWTRARPSCGCRRCLGCTTAATGWSVRPMLRRCGAPRRARTGSPTDGAVSAG
jgi:hypothetical protein